MAIGSEPCPKPVAQRQDSGVKAPLRGADISPMPSDSAPEPVHHQRLHLLFRQAKVASYLAVVSGFACAGLFVYGTGEWTALAWLSGVVVASLLRLHLFRRFFTTEIQHHPESYWLRRHAATAVLVGISWGLLPLVPSGESAHYLHEMQTLVPAFVLMAAITSYGIYFNQYLVLLGSMTLVTLGARLYTSGADGIPEVALFALFVPMLALTAKRYADSLLSSTRSKHRAEELVGELTRTNDELQLQNNLLAQQQDLLQQEETLAKHVFAQLTLGGDHALPGIHTWNQSMGSLSGDLTQKARGPDGEAYVFLGDFTGHGLPAALGALPASSIFLAMAAKGLPVESIASELNCKLRELLPVGYFCCGVLLQLSADRRTVHLWNGGLPPVLIRRRAQQSHEYLRSHSLPLGVVDGDTFDASALDVTLGPGDLLYAYTDGLTEAENVDGEMWGSERLEELLLRDDLPAPRLPVLIDAVLEHVNLAPASDDISVLEVEVTPAVVERADEADAA